MATENIVETLRDILASLGPSLITKEDVSRLEQRLDELEEIVDEIEDRLAGAAEEA